MTDIQRARDVLAKWRTEATSGTWTFGDTGEFEWRIWPSDTDPLDGGSHASTLESTDARLVVGTAGNPDLLDAIDALLAAMIPWREAGLSTEFLMRAERIAAAIITADERMNA